MAKPTHKKFDEEHIAKIKNDLNRWLGPEWGNSFDDAKNKAQWFLVNEERLLTNDNFVKNYDIESLINVDAKKMSSLFNRYPDFDKLTGQQLKRFTRSTNISEDELKKYYDYEHDRRKKMDEFNASRYAELDKKRREAERSKDNSYYNSWLANEFARKAYIEGDKDMAGKQEFLGKTAAVTDFMPLPVSLVGPAIRTAQKKWAGEDPYTLSTGADIAGAIIPDFIEKPAKAALSLLKGKAGQVIGKSKAVKNVEDVVNRRVAQEEAKEAQEQAARQLSLTNIDPGDKDDAMIAMLYEEIDDPALKTGLENIRTARTEFREAQKLGENTDLPKFVVNDAVDDAYERVLRAEEQYRELQRKAVPGLRLKADQPEIYLDMDNLEISKQMPFVKTPEGTQFNPYYKDVPMRELLEYAKNKNYVPSFTDNVIYNALNLVGRKAMRSTVGGRIGQLNTIDTDPKYNEDKAIKEIQNMFSKDWVNGKPANYDDPLIKKAYDRWLEDQYRAGNYDVIWRLGEE